MREGGEEGGREVGREHVSLPMGFSKCRVQHNSVTSCRPDTGGLPRFPVSNLLHNDRMRTSSLQCGMNEKRLHTLHAKLES